MNTIKIECEILIVVILLSINQLAVSQDIVDSDQALHAEMIDLLNQGILNSRVAIAEDSGIFTDIYTRNLDKTISCRNLVQLLEDEVPELRRRVELAQVENARIPEVTYGGILDPIAYGWSRTKAFIDVTEACNMMRDERESNLEPTEQPVEMPGTGSEHEGYGVIVEAAIMLHMTKIITLMRSDLVKYGSFGQQSIEVADCGVFLKDAYAGKDEELWEGVQKAREVNLFLEENGTPTYSSMHLEHGVRNEVILDVLGFCGALGEPK